MSAIDLTKKTDISSILQNQKSWEANRNRIGVAAVILIMLTFASAVYTEAPKIVQNPQNFSGWVSPVVSALAIIIDLWVLKWLRQRRVVAAANLMLAVNLILMIVNAAFSPGDNILIGLTVAIVSSTFSGAVLPPRLVARGMLASFSGGALIMVSDYVFPAHPGLSEVALPVLAECGTLSIIFLALLLLNYNHFAMNAKLLLIGSMVSLMTALAMFVPVYFILDTLRLEGQAAIANQIEGTLALAASGMLVLITLLSQLIARTISRPLQTISTAALKISGGEISDLWRAPEAGSLPLTDELIDIQAHSEDEIGELAGSFIGMADYQLQMTRTAERMAEGDLAVKVSPKSEKDILGQGFATMAEKFSLVISQIAESAEALSLACNELERSAQLNNSHLQQIAATMQGVASGICQQTASISRTAASIDEMSSAIDGVAKGAQDQAGAVANASVHTVEINNMIQQVTGYAQVVSQASIESAQIARDGTNKVDETVRGMQAIRSKVDLSVQKVKEMGAHSEQIGVFVQTIEDIASQTNLLALNAAIEAARAGEHGKGFSVVASEVTKLAESSAQSAKKISALVKDIQSTVSQAVAVMEEGSTEVDSGVQLANRARDSLYRILDGIENVSHLAELVYSASNKMETLADKLVSAVDTVSAVVEENTAATEQMATNSSAVSQAIEVIASVSEENNAAVEEVTASTDEIKGQSSDVARAVKNLAEMAKSLKQLISNFKLANE